MLQMITEVNIKRYIAEFQNCRGFGKQIRSSFHIVSSVFTFTLKQPCSILLNSAGALSWASLTCSAKPTKIQKNLTLYIAGAMGQECMCV